MTIFKIVTLTLNVIILAVSISVSKPAEGGSGGEIVESGICSYYGEKDEIPDGWPTACGDGFDPFELRAGHKSLPCGTKVRVSNRKSGKSVNVTVNDRGMFYLARVLDLTYAAFGMLEHHSSGLFDCEYEILE